MESLYNLFIKELQQSNIESYKNLEFVTNRKKCAEFIDHYIGKYWNVNKDINNNFHIAQNRAVHSVITYLMGRVFGKIGNINVEIDYDEKVFERLWSLTSMNHDRAYYSKYIEKEIFYEEVFGIDHLLTRQYSDSCLEIFDNFEDKNEL